MNEPRTSALILWGRLISGETLDEVELQKLTDFVQQDSSLKREIEADASLHALLRSATEVPQTENQFIQGVLDRCSELNHGTQPKGERNQSVHRVSPHPGSISPSDEIQETTSVDGTSLPLAANQSEKSANPYRKRRQPSAWAATAVTAAIFAGLGLIVWTQLGPPSSKMASNPSNGVVQGPTLEQSIRPDSRSMMNDVTPSTNDDPAPSRPIVADRGHATQPSPDTVEHQEPTLVENQQMQPDIQNAGLPNPPDSDSPGQFVTLTNIQDPVWERKSVVGDRMGREIVRLFAGTAELTFDEGAVVTVEGPVEFRPLSTGQLELRRGRLLASVPQEAIGFTVSTPTSKIVDLGTEFEVAVNDAGESDVQVLKGEVEVASITPNGDQFQKWRLVPSKFDRASFFARPRSQGPTPISASLHGPRGQFQGFVSIDGQTAEFASPEAFENVRRRAESELARSQENTLRQWKAFVDSMQNNIQGSMKLNGQEMQFGNLQDVMRLQQQMMENVQKPGKNPSEPGFKGSINVNGKNINFNTREQYEAARRAAFGPAATFGIGDVLGKDSESR